MKKKIKLVISKASSFVAPLFNQPKKHLKTWLVIFLALIAGLAAFFFLLSPRTTEAAWWDETWLYRKAVQISNSNGADLTDFQVAITLDTTSLITAGKMQGDCDDLRITDQNGQILPHWIEENNPGCNNAATKVWVKIPTIHKGDNATTVYAYYGNSQAENAENGDNVFDFFDDFNSSILDTSIWTATSTYTISGGEITMASGAVYTNDTILTTAQNYVYEYRVKWNASSGTYSGLQIANAQNVASGNVTSKALVFYMSGHNNLSITAYAADGTTTGYNLASNQAQYTATQGTYYVDSFVVNPTNIIFLNNRSQTNSYAGTWSAAPYLWLGYFAGSNAGTTSIKSMTTDWVLVRKYASSEPTAGTPAAEEISPGPVAYWKFDEGTGTVANDSSGQGNHGTFGIDSSAPSWQSEDMCVSGKCLKFDGNDYVNSGNGNSLNFSTGNFSIGGWFKAKPGNTTRAIASKNSDNVIWWRIQIQTDGTLNFQFDDNIVKYSWTSTSRVDDNNWHHFSITRGSTYEIYIDGKSQNASGTINASTLTNSGNLLIGGDLKGSYFFDGFIDEVKIYPYARTKEQIKADYAAGLAGIGSAKGSSAIMGSSGLASALNDGLVGYWKMDEASWNGTAGEVIDASGNGNHGVGVGSTKPTTGTGKFGNGGVLDGASQYLNVPDPAGASLDFTSTQNLTISTWLNYSDTTGTNYLLAKGGSLWGSGNNGPGYMINYYEDNGTIYFRVGDSSSRKECSYAVELNNSSWNHLVFTLNRQSNLIKGYLNGTEICSASSVGLGDLSNAYALTLGSYSNAGAGNHWQGKLDEVRIYNRALSTTEVKALYEWAPGPVAHYTFDDSSNFSTVADISGYGNNGTWFGSSTNRYAAGKYGSAGVFNGSNDYVETQTSSKLDIGMQLTVSAWIKRESNTHDWESIVNHIKKASDYDGYWIGSSANGKIRAFVGPYTNYVETDNTINNNVWNYVSLISNGATFAIYVNGVQASPNKNVGLITTTEITTRIGKSVASSEYFNGLIDDVRIYNYVRTQKQILEDMAGGAPGAARMPQPVAHWRFDEGYGTTAHDSVGTNHGTFAAGDAAPTWTNEGKVGKALSFDGSNDYVNFGNPSSGALDFNAGQSFSACGWFKLNSLPTSYPYNPLIILSKKEVNNDNAGWVVYLSSSQRVSLKISDGASSQNLSSNSSLFSVGNWAHFCTISSGSNSKTYINGKDETYSNNTNLSYDLRNSTNLYLGRNQSDGYYFNGLIDEVKIYNYALTPEEVALDYNQGMAAVMGQSSANTGSSASAGSAAQEYCVPGSSDYCAPPVAEWNFEENTGTTARDTSGNGNDGTITGASWAKGVNGGAGLRFDGNDYVNNGTNFSQSLSNFSISAWVNTTQTTASSFYGVIERGGWNTGEIGLFMCGSSCTSGTMRFQANELTTNQAVDSLTTVNDGNWHHVLGTYDGSSLKIYIDGKLSNSKTASGSISIDTESIYIGSRLGNTLFFNGLIDDVKIYDYARTPAQVAWDYNRGAPVGHWRFDECEGTVAHDVSGNDNHGTINIGATAPQTSAGTCQTPGTAWGNGAAGKLNSAMSFDGVDDWVSISDNTNHFDFGTGNFTFSAWIYKPSGGKGSPGIISKNGNPGYKFNLNANTELYLGIYDGSWHDYASATSIVKNNSWQHVAITADRDGNVGYFVNGELKDTDNISGTALVNLSNSSSLLIGDDNWCRADYCGQFDGLIDDVQIFNYALTPLQIKTLYNNGAVRFGE